VQTLKVLLQSIRDPDALGGTFQVLLEARGGKRDARKTWKGTGGKSKKRSPIRPLASFNHQSDKRGGGGVNLKHFKKKEGDIRIKKRTLGRKRRVQRSGLKNRSQRSGPSDGRNFLRGMKQQRRLQGHPNARRRRPEAG